MDNCSLEKKGQMSKTQVLFCLFFVFRKQRQDKYQNTGIQFWRMRGEQKIKLLHGLFAWVWISESKCMCNLCVCVYVCSHHCFCPYLYPPDTLYYFSSLKTIILLLWSALLLISKLHTVFIVFRIRKTLQVSPWTELSIESYRFKCCLGYFLLLWRHYDQSTLEKKMLIGSHSSPVPDSLESIIVVAGNMAAGRQKWHWNGSKRLTS